MLPFAYHFSIDDSFDCLWRSSNGILAGDRASEIDLLAFFDDLHHQFDANIDVYLFFQQTSADRVVSLNDIASRTKYFQDRGWLRFAPHAIDKATPPYSQPPTEAGAFYDLASEQIDRITGPNRHSRWVRLHYFSECYELAPLLRSRGVEALLTTDKPVGSYRLPRFETEQLKREGISQYAGIHFVRSHVRIENLANRCLNDDQLDSELDAICANSPCAVILTHEYELVQPEVREMTYRVFSWIQRRQLSSIADSKLRLKLLDLPNSFPSQAGDRR